MKINVKYLENQYCAPRDHPITCANPAPWLIEEVKIECQEKVWVRGKESMWFGLDNCVLDTKEALEEWLEHKEQMRKEKFNMQKNVQEKVQGIFENLSDEQIKELSKLTDKSWLEEILKLKCD